MSRKIATSTGYFLRLSAILFLLQRAGLAADSPSLQLSIAQTPPFHEGDNLTLTATLQGISDSDVRAVQFFWNYVGGGMLGSTEQVAPGSYSTTRSNLPAGQFAFVAAAFLNSGGTNVARTNITVYPKNEFFDVSVTALDAEASKLQASSNLGFFRIYRTGSTEGNAGVYYHLEGTAKAGADYERNGTWMIDDSDTVEGSVTIPIGQSSVLVPVVPIRGTNRGGDPLSVKLVLESLPASSDGQNPRYNIVAPSTAEVFIFEGARPATPPSIGIQTIGDGLVRLAITGEVNYECVTEWGTELGFWSPVGTNILFNGQATLTNSLDSKQRLYRAYYR